MNKYTLTAIDSSGIQNYLFSTNNLRQNVGASYLVKLATGKWIEECLPPSHNVLDIDHEETPFDTAKTIEGNQLAAEVLYTGGGKVLILFADAHKAIQFTKKLTQKVLLEAPGLRLLMTHKHDLDWTNGDHALGGEDGQVDAIMKQLDCQKRKITPTYATLGLGVTAKCAFTGLPATGFDKDDRPISSEAKSKLKAEGDAHKELKASLGLNELEQKEYEIPRDFDQLGGTHGESSYIAVIHADGNHMGDRIKAIQHNYPQVSQNREYINKMRAFSIDLKKTAADALRATTRFLLDRIDAKPDPLNALRKIYTIGKRSNGEGGIELARESKSDKPMLPFRPIVFGGDDTTFVCDGRLGLSLAKYFLEEFAKNKPDGNLHAHCRAGVAVVHSHYPFSRAYDLADELCASAKRAITSWEKESVDDGVSAIDWHFAVGGLIRSLDDTRYHEFTSREGINLRKKGVERDGDLLMRPLRLNDPGLDWRSWQTFTNMLEKFDGEGWQERRNKLKDLREVLRQGTQVAVEQFRITFRLPLLPEVPQHESMPPKGWQGKNCGYFDAIEAMDHFLDLEKVQSSVSKEKTT